MKELVNERLKLLATAQESMVEVVDIMEQWDNSQLVLEKSAFDSINISDKALNLSREGNKLVLKLQECCRFVSENPPGKTDIEAMTALLSETKGLFIDILEAAKSSNEIAHSLEQEVAYQRDIAEHMKKSVDIIGRNVDQTVACAEFLMAEL